tara:strand:- start:51 stop:575 length:525 start_codon:yes stop_codon:yes gene_type:complete
MNDIGNLATSIWDNEFGDETGAAHRTSEISSISGWLGANVGQLNNYIYTAFSGASDGQMYPVGEFQLEEQNIFTQIYLSHYYKKKARNVLRGIDGSLNSDIDWIRLKEGDSLIVRSNKTDVSKVYLNLSKEADEKLTNLVYYYNIYQAKPRQVAGRDGDVGPSGSYTRPYPYYR